MHPKPTAGRITPGEGGETQHIEGGEGVRGFRGLISVAHASRFATSIRPPSLRSALRVRGYSIESERPSPEIPDEP